MAKSVSSKNKDYHNSIGTYVAVAVPLIIIAIAAFVLISWFQENYIDTSMIDRIHDMQRGPNEFYDIGNEIGVESAADLYYMVDENNYNVTLYYGKEVIKIPKNALKDEEYVEKLGSIGITFEQRLNPENEKEIQYRFMYWGEDIVQAVQKY